MTARLNLILLHLLQEKQFFISESGPIRGPQRLKPSPSVWCKGREAPRVPPPRPPPGAWGGSDGLPPPAAMLPVSPAARRRTRRRVGQTPIRVGQPTRTDTHPSRADGGWSVAPRYTPIRVGARAHDAARAAPKTVVEGVGARQLALESSDSPV